MGAISSLRRSGSRPHPADAFNWAAMERRTVEMFAELELVPEERAQPAPTETSEPLEPCTAASELTPARSEECMVLLSVNGTPEPSVDCNSNPTSPSAPGLEPGGEHPSTQKPESTL